MSYASDLYARHNGPKSPESAPVAPQVQQTTPATQETQPSAQDAPKSSLLTNEDRAALGLPPKPELEPVPTLYPGQSAPTPPKHEDSSWASRTYANNNAPKKESS